MAFKYERPLHRETEDGKKSFSVGTHAATITKVKKLTSKKGSPMFILTVTGKSDEEGLFFLVFGNDFTCKNINFLLASIEDNGVEIPDIDYGFNKETYQFLKDKDVYIEIVEREYNDEIQFSVDKFLTLDEFEKSEDDNSGQNDDDWD